MYSLVRCTAHSGDDQISARRRTCCTKVLGADLNWSPQMYSVHQNVEWGYQMVEIDHCFLDRSAASHFLVLPWKAEDCTASKPESIPSLERRRVDPHWRRRHHRTALQGLASYEKEKRIDILILRVPRNVARREVRMCECNHGGTVS